MGTTRREVSGYRIYLGTYTDPISDDFNLLTTIEDSTSFSLPFDLDLETIYHWQVVAFNEAGDGEASVTWSFITHVEAPSRVELVFPGYNYEDVSSTPTFIWETGNGGIPEE